VNEGEDGDNVSVEHPGNGAESGPKLTNYDWSLMIEALTQIFASAPLLGRDLSQCTASGGAACVTNALASRATAAAEGGMGTGSEAVWRKGRGCCVHPLLVRPPGPRQEVRRRCGQLRGRL